MRNMALCFVLLWMSIFLTGCWDRRELSELALVSGMGIDKLGEDFVLTFQIPNVKSMGKQGGAGLGPPFSVYQEKGGSVLECMRRMANTLPRTPYLAHLRILVIGEEIARQGLEDVLDYLSRDGRTRPDFYVIVARNSRAYEVLTKTTQIETLAAQNLYDNLERALESWAPVVAVYIENFISDLESSGKDPVLTGVEIVQASVDEHLQSEKNKNDPGAIHPNTELKYTGIGVFNDTKLVGWLNEEESKGYNYLRDSVKTTVGIAPCEKEQQGGVTMRISGAKTKVSVSLKQGKLQYFVKQHIQANVAEVNCEMDLQNPKTLEYLKKATEKAAIEIMKSTIRKQAEMHVDILGLGDIVHQKYPAYWRKNHKNWPENVNQAPFTFDTKVKIMDTGTESQSFQWKYKHRNEDT